MDKFLEYLKEKTIHIVGVTGAEGSNILRFLIKHGAGNIIVHDFGRKDELEKNFKLWHKGIPTAEKNKLFKQFTMDLKGLICNFDTDYLQDVTDADIIFAPQSWRLYRQQNLSLWDAKKKNIPLYSLTRLYLDYAPATIVAVTGTVGKGSVANILVQLLQNSLPAERKVYFAGNETWMVQIADKMDKTTKEDILVLEISHRQLQDGFSRAPYMAVFTNLYPNHLDEVSWEEYQKLKLSLVMAQTASNIAVLNYDVPKLRESAMKLKSKVVFYSGENKYMNTKNIQNIHKDILNIKSVHYAINILAASTAADILGIDCEQIKKYLPSISALPARLEYLGETSGVKFYDDIKSTSPRATLAGVQKLGQSTILICGGRSKNIDYQEFATQIKQLVKYIILLKSEMSQQLVSFLPQNMYREFTDLSLALQFAYQKAKLGDNVLISPAAGFFYSDYIKGRKSLRKLIISLPPREQVAEARKM